VNVHPVRPLVSIRGVRKVPRVYQPNVVNPYEARHRILQRLPEQQIGIVTVARPAQVVVVLVFFQLALSL
jgi:hypothetical protein